MSESSVAYTLHQFAAVAAALPEQSTSFSADCTPIRVCHHVSQSSRFVVVQQSRALGFCAIKRPGLQTLATCA
eukprot:4267298-Amphidinium_carterae.1